MLYSNKRIHNRRKAVARLAAIKALEFPIFPSGFWFHHDVRDNFYYASHLFAYCVDQEFACEWSDEKCETSKKVALNMLCNILSLQEKNPQNPMYGHWPLYLGSNPSEAEPNQLTVELLGCMLVLFYDKYQNHLPAQVKQGCNEAISHIYKSKVYHLPLKYMVHHGAKHTALKILLGHFFNDHELMDEGVKCAKQLLDHIQKFGFKEYGSLPWFWHWVQAFTCVWEVVDNVKVRNITCELLDYLWRYRADYYLKGTWVGPHSRQTLHDVPKDLNILMDYIQFGDFPLPNEIVRLEGSALFSYEVSGDLVQRTIDRSEVVEVKRKIQVANVEGIVKEELHTYVFIDPAYAMGGIWERVIEYENEQLRWKVTFPLTHTNVENGVNQAFFFHPCEKYSPDDDRHTSNFGEVMYYKDNVIQIWSIPLNDKEAYQSIIGCLPLGEWIFETSSGYGRVGDAYLTFQLMNEFNIEEKKDRISIASPFSSNWNGVIMEVISCKNAADLGIYDLESFSAAMKVKNKSCFTTTNLDSRSEEKVSVSYITWRNDKLHFSMDNRSGCERLLNEQLLFYSDYPIV